MIIVDKSLLQQIVCLRNLIIKNYTNDVLIN
jgi:hypothetical protein